MAFLRFNINNKNYDVKVGILEGVVYGAGNQIDLKQSFPKAKVEGTSLRNAIPLKEDYDNFDLITPETVYHASITKRTIYYAESGSVYHQSVNATRFQNAVWKEGKEITISFGSGSQILNIEYTTMGIENTYYPIGYAYGLDPVPDLTTPAANFVQNGNVTFYITVNSQGLPALAMNNGRNIVISNTPYAFVNKVWGVENWLPFGYMWGRSFRVGGNNFLYRPNKDLLSFQNVYGEHIAAKNREGALSDAQWGIDLYDGIGNITKATYTNTLRIERNWYSYLYNTTPSTDEPNDPENGEPENKPDIPSEEDQGGNGDYDDGSQPINPPSIPTSLSNTGLIKVYRIAAEDISNFGNALWKEAFAKDLIALFSNPMDAVISLKAFDFDVPYGQSQNITVGNVTLQVPSGIITNNFVQLDFGEKDITEYYGSYLDYQETSIEIYLPHIGVMALTKDVMNARISLIYTIDVISGECIAMLNVNQLRTNLNSVIYTFTGQCGYTIPLSGRDYSQYNAVTWNVKENFWTNSILKGGMLANPLGTAQNVLDGYVTSQQALANIQHGSSLQSNISFANIKTPYLIITRVRTFNQNWYVLNGYNWDGNAKLSDLDGYTTVNVEDIEIKNATKEEIEEIKSLLKQGVIL